LLEWVRFNKGTLLQHELYATGTTGKVLEKELNSKITIFESGPLGSDQQIGARIAEGCIASSFSSGTLSCCRCAVVSVLDAMCVIIFTPRMVTNEPIQPMTPRYITRIEAPISDSRVARKFARNHELPLSVSFRLRICRRWQM
jgi:hypothetical protein